MRNHSFRTLGPIAAGALVAVLLGTLGIPTAHASGPAAAQGLASPKQVILATKGSDRLDQLARMAAAMSLLEDVTSSLAPKARGGSWLNPNDQRLYSEYNGSFLNVCEAAYAITGSKDYPSLQSAREQWNVRRDAYRGDAAFIRETLQMHAPPAVAEQYLALAGRSGQVGGFNAHMRQSTAAIATAKSQAYAKSWPGMVQIWMMHPASLLSGALVIILLLPALAMMFVSLRGRADVDESDPNVVHLGNRRFDLKSLTGIVMGKERMLETRTHVSGGGSTVVGNTVHNSPVTTTHTTIDHLHFFVRSKDGKEQEVALRNAIFSVRDGHVVSITGAMRDGASDRALFVMFKNHSTGQVFYLDGNLNTLLAPRGVFIDILKVALFLVSIPMLLLPLIPFVIVAHVVRGIQRRRVSAQMNARFVPLLDHKAAAVDMAG